MKTKKTRREFLKASASGALGAFIIPGEIWKNSGMTSTTPLVPDEDIRGLGLQLYTIRDAMAKDVPGSLEKVAKTGYRYLELADYNRGKFYGYEPAEFKRLAASMGLECISSHASVDSRGVTQEEAKKMADDHAKLGVKYCIHPYVAEGDRKTIARYQALVADWNMVGRVMKENGIQFGYHNHNFEFDTVQGKIPYTDIFLAELDKEYVTMELDLFWAIKAGQDPVSLFKKYPGRFKLFHMKDMYTREAPFYDVSSNDFAPVGAGVVDFRKILASADVAGMQYMFVEQDNTRDGKPFDAIQESFTNLTTKILT